MIDFDKRYLAKCSSLLSWAKDRLDACQHVKARNVLLKLEQLNGADPILAYPQLQLRMLNLLASAERHLRLMEPAVSRLRRCLEICEAFGCEKGETLITLAAVYMDLNSFEEAKTFCEEALEQFTALNSKDRNSTYGRLIATCCYNIGQCCLELGKPGKAAQSFSNGMVSLRRMVVAPDDALLKLLEKAYKESLHEARFKEPNPKTREEESSQIIKHLHMPASKGFTLKSNPKMTLLHAQQDLSVSTKQSKEKTKPAVYHRKHLSANQTKLSYFAGADNRAQVANYMPIRHLSKNLKTEAKLAERSAEVKCHSGLVDSWKDSADADISIHSSRTSVYTSRQTDQSVRGAKPPGGISRPLKKLSSVTVIGKRPSSALTNPQKEHKKYLISHNTSSRKIKPQPPALDDCAVAKLANDLAVSNKSIRDKDCSDEEVQELSQVTEKLHLKTDESKEVADGASGSHVRSSQDLVKSTELRYRQGRAAASIQRAWRNYQYSHSRLVRSFRKEHPKAVWISTSFQKVKKDRVNGHRLIPCKLMVYHTKSEYLVAVLQAPFIKQTALVQVPKTENVLGQLDNVRLDPYGKGYFLKEAKTTPACRTAEDKRSASSMPENRVQGQDSCETVAKIADRANEKREILELKQELREQVQQMEATRKQLETLMASMQDSRPRTTNTTPVPIGQTGLESMSKNPNELNGQGLEVQPIDTVPIAPARVRLTIEQASKKKPVTRKVIAKAQIANRFAKKPSSESKTEQVEPDHSSDERSIQLPPALGFAPTEQSYSFAKKKESSIVQPSGSAPNREYPQGSGEVASLLKPQPLPAERIGHFDQVVGRSAVEDSEQGTSREEEKGQVVDSSRAREKVALEEIRILEEAAVRELEDRMREQQQREESELIERLAWQETIQVEWKAVEEYRRLVQSQQITQSEQAEQRKIDSEEDSRSSRPSEEVLPARLPPFVANLEKRDGPDNKLFTFVPEEPSANQLKEEHNRSSRRSNSIHTSSDSRSASQSSSVHEIPVKASEVADVRVAAAGGRRDSMPRFGHRESIKDHPLKLQPNMSFGIGPTESLDVKPVDLPERPAVLVKPTARSEAQLVHNNQELDNSKDSEKNASDHIKHLAPKKYEAETSRSNLSNDSHLRNSDLNESPTPAPKPLNLVPGMPSLPVNARLGSRKAPPARAAVDSKQREVKQTPDNYLEQIERLQEYKLGLYIRHFNIDAGHYTEELIEQAEDFFDVLHPVQVCFQLDDHMPIQAKAKSRHDLERFKAARHFMIEESFWKNIVAEPVYAELIQQMHGLNRSKPAVDTKVLSLFKEGLDAMMISRTNQIKIDQQISPRKIHEVEEKTGNKGYLLDTAQYLYSFIRTQIEGPEQPEEPQSKDPNVSQVIKIPYASSNSRRRIGGSSRKIDRAPNKTLAELEGQYKEQVQTAVSHIFACMIKYYEENRATSRRQFSKGHCQRMIEKLERKKRLVMRQAETSKKNKRELQEKTAEEKAGSSEKTELELNNERDLKVFGSNKKYFVRNVERPLYQLPVIRTFAVQNNKGSRFTIKIRLMPTAPQQFYVVETWSSSDNFIDAKAFAETVFETQMEVDNSKTERLNRIVSILIRSLGFETKMGTLTKGAEAFPVFNLEVGIKRREHFDHDPLVSTLY